MIKTIKDAHEALKGDLKNTNVPERADTHLFWDIDGGYYICGSDRNFFSTKMTQYICTVEEFNNYKESNMIKFDLEKALAGEKVVTRDGREVTQLHVFHHRNASIIHGYDVENDTIEQWFIAGNYHNTKGDCGGDLFMAPKQLSGFVNVYNQHICDVIFRTKRAAGEYHTRNRIACIDLSQFPEGHGLD